MASTAHADQPELDHVDPEVQLFCSPTLNITVRAHPMALGPYLKLRGWKASADTDLTEQGYVVERPDMGPPNQAGYEHFIAWLPKGRFEAVYTRAGTQH